MARKLRLEQGESRRRVFPRTEHARWTANTNRLGVVELLTKSNDDRLASIIPIRHSRMLESPLSRLGDHAFIKNRVGTACQMRLFVN